MNCTQVQKIWLHLKQINRKLNWFMNCFKNGKLLTSKSWNNSLTEINDFRYDQIEFPDNDNTSRGIVVASSLVNLFINVIPLRIVNMSDKPKVIKEDEGYVL